MSRHSVVTNRGNKEVTYNYGYDNPLMQYWLTVTVVEVNEDAESLCDIDGGIYDLVGPFAPDDPKCLYGSASNLRHVMDIEGIWDKIPKRHQDAIMSDLPF